MKSIISSIIESFVWPSRKKLALLPAAFFAAAAFWQLCQLAESMPLPGLAGPTRTSHLWWLYSVLYFVTLVDAIGVTTRASPSWWKIPAREAFAGIVYPFSILASRVCLPFVTLGFLDSTAAIWAGPLAAFAFRNHYAPSATFNPLRFLRGARRLEQGKMTSSVGDEIGRETSAADAGHEPDQFRYLGLHHPPRRAEGHFAIVGTPGSGKSLQPNELIASVVPEVQQGSDLRAVIYDVKGSTPSFLYQLGIPDDRMVILNPFDVRSHAWDLAKDIDSPAAADALAAALLPERPQDLQPFFVNAARAVLRQIVLVLVGERGGEWTLRDLIHLTSSPARIRAILSKSPKGRDVIDQFKRPRNAFGAFVQEIGTALRPLEAVAALWEHADRKFVVSEWMRGRESILILDGRPEHRASLVPLNRVFFNVFSRLLTSERESPTRTRFWAFVDELQEASRLEGLPAMVNLGRSKGIRCAFGFQDLEGLERHWGKAEAEKLASIARNLSVLRLTSPRTAEWASRRFGELEEIDIRISWGASTTWSEQLNRKAAVMPSEMLHLPDPSLTPEGQVRVKGFHVLLGLEGVLEHQAEFPIFKSIPALDFIPRPKEQQHLTEFSARDATRLGVRTRDRKPHAEEREEVNELAEEDNTNDASPKEPEDFDGLIDFSAPE